MLIRRLAVSTGAVVLCGLMAACADGGPAAPGSPNVWATVDGREITRESVEQAYRRVAPAGAAPSAEEAAAAKLSLLNELIVQDILVARASAEKIEVTEAELDAAFSERKANLPEDRFEKELTSRGLTTADMREGLRRELLAQKVVEHAIGSKVNVTEQEVTDYFTANRAQFNLPEPAYRVAQIVVTPTPEANLNNRTRDDAASVAASDRKVQMLMEQLKSGRTFSELASDYSEDPDTAPRGGDLGFLTESRLKQAPPEMRDAVLRAKPGSVTKLSANGAHTLVMLITREPAGQRDLSQPEVREGITSTLRDRKSELLRSAYLTTARNGATVVNYLAQQITDGQLPGAGR